MLISQLLHSPINTGKRAFEKELSDLKGEFDEILTNCRTIINNEANDEIVSKPDMKIKSKTVSTYIDKRKFYDNDELIDTASRYLDLNSMVAGIVPMGKDIYDIQQKKELDNESSLEHFIIEQNSFQTKSIITEEGNSDLLSTINVDSSEIKQSIIDLKLLESDHFPKTNDINGITTDTNVSQESTKQYIEMYEDSYIYVSGKNMEQKDEFGIDYDSGISSQMYTEETKNSSSFAIYEETNNNFSSDKYADNINTTAIKEEGTPPHRIDLHVSYNEISKTEMTYTIHNYSEHIKKFDFAKHHFSPKITRPIFYRDISTTKNTEESQLFNESFQPNLDEDISQPGCSKQEFTSLILDKEIALPQNKVINHEDTSIIQYHETFSLKNNVESSEILDFSKFLKGNDTSLKEKLIGDLVYKVTSMVTKDHSEVEISLKPEYLGKMVLKLVLQDGDLYVRISAESQQVRDFLMNNAQDLKDTLSEQGVNLFQLDVNLQNEKKNNQPFHMNEINKKLKSKEEALSEELFESENRINITGTSIFERLV